MALLAALALGAGAVYVVKTQQATAEAAKSAAASAQLAFGGGGSSSTTTISTGLDLDGDGRFTDADLKLLQPGASAGETTLPDPLKDSDGDGVPDAIDAFPFDPARHLSAVDLANVDLIKSQQALVDAQRRSMENPLVDVAPPGIPTVPAAPGPNPVTPLNPTGAAPGPANPNVVVKVPAGVATKAFTVGSVGNDDDSIRALYAQQKRDGAQGFQNTGRQLYENTKTQAPDGEAHRLYRIWTSVNGGEYRAPSSSSSTSQPTQAPSSGTPAASFFEHTKFGGKAVALPPGRYSVADLQARGIPNDWISSLKVAKGYRVLAYEHGDFTGSQIGGTADLNDLVPSGWNDRISSIVISKV